MLSTISLIYNRAYLCPFPNLFDEGRRGNFVQNGGLHPPSAAAVLFWIAILFRGFAAVVGWCNAIRGGRRRRRGLLSQRPLLGQPGLGLVKVLPGQRVSGGPEIRERKYQFALICKWNLTKAWVHYSEQIFLSSRVNSKLNTANPI